MVCTVSNPYPTHIVGEGDGEFETGKRKVKVCLPEIIQMFNSWICIHE